MPQPPLTPAQAFVLLDPRRSSPTEAFKIALLSLVAQGVLKIEMVQRTYFLRTSTVPVISRMRMPPDSFLANEISDIVMQAIPSSIGTELRSITAPAVQAFGPGLVRLKTSYIVPSLVSRGLLAQETETVLLLFNRTRFVHTRDGLLEKHRIEDILARARQLPTLLGAAPEQAKAIVLASGPLLLLVPELKTYYAQLAALDPAGSFNGGDASWPGEGGGSLDHGSFDAHCLNLDFGSFDHSFDSAFSDAGGHGGSDGHGGDGGGHH